MYYWIRADQTAYMQMTTTPVKSLAITGPLSKPLQVPYDFQPEFKPQDIGVEFRLLVNDGVSMSCLSAGLHGWESGQGAKGIAGTSSSVW